MASCLVPEFPAVKMVLEHLKELDKQLIQEGEPFATEVSRHLAEISAAITELEAKRRATHEHLEVKTIENSELRHQICSISERMSEEIKADVAAVRESHAEEMKQLQEDLSAACRLKEEAAARQQELLDENKALYPEREQVKVEHEALVAALNDEITRKYSLQMQLDQKREQIEELKSRIAAVEQDKLTLQQNMKLDRDAFSAQKDNLTKEEDEIEEKIKQQKEAIRRKRSEMDRVNKKKEAAHGCLNELTIHMERLERNTDRLTASWCQCEKQLEREAQKHQELNQQREMLKKQPRELEEAFSLTIQRLKEEIATVEGKIEEGRASRRLCRKALAQTREIYKHQQEEENQVRAEHSRVSQQLQRSKLQLEDRMASMVKYSQEIKKMDKQIVELREADTINKRMFEKHQEELCVNVDTEKKNISHLEEEERQLNQLLEEAKRKQEEHVAKVKSDISSVRKRYEELLQEEAALLQRQPRSTDADVLMSHITQCEMEYKQMESMRKQEIQQCTAELESIMKSNEEKQREVGEKEEILKEVQAKWNEEKSRHERLEQLCHELKMRKAELEQSIQGMKEKTSSLLQPREEKKAKLKELQEHHINRLDKQAAELRAVEVSIYNNSVKLEQVSMENSRLHLAIRQMTEDVIRARQSRDRYQQESQQLIRDTKALRESLQEAWREALLASQGHQSRDGAALESMSSLLDHLETRRQQLGNVSTLLHREMLNFSRRLGEKVTMEDHG